MSRDLESLGERIAEHAAHLDAAMHRLLTDLRAFDRGGGWHAQGARTCAHWLSWRVGWNLATSREHVRVASKLAELPSIDKALQQGELSYSKVRAVTRVATPANEATLLELARVSTGGQLETICRKYRAVGQHDAAASPQDDAQRRAVSRRDTIDGMVRIEAVLHPEEAAVVWAALEHAAKRQCREDGSAGALATELRSPDGAAAPAGDPHATDVSAEGSASELCDRHATAEPPDAELLDSAACTGRRVRFDRADALVAIAQGYVRGGKRDRAPIEVVLTVPVATLRRDTVEHDPVDVACFADGTCVAAETARRLACDCGVVGVTEDERGMPLAVGRKRRTIPGSMKRALLKRDQVCCFPGCENRVFLEAHHIRHWADGGETNLDNMISACSFHHRFTHEYGYTVQLGPDGARFFDPHGRQVHEVPAMPQPAGLGWDAIRTRNQRLEISAATNEPGWDGSLLDYGHCIDTLVRVDGSGSCRT